MKVGVLALQGAEARHRAMLARLGAQPVAVRTPDQVDDLDGLVIPGGESTTISKLLESAGLFEPVADRLAGGLPVFGTCAGMILLAGTVLDGRDDQRSFGAFDATVRRNAFGRQVDSFEADLVVDGLAGGSEGSDGSGDSGDTRSSRNGSGARRFRAVFIRAPIVEQVGPTVDVLATVDDRPVLCRQGHVLVAAFHPELGDDTRLHELFLDELI